MSPVPAEKDAAKESKPPPSALDLLGTGFNTATATVGFIMGTTAFLALMARFNAHLKLTASKWFARRKIKELEDQAAKENDNTKLDKRNLNWEMTTYGKWD